MGCFAVSVGSVHNESIVSVVNFDGQIDGKILYQYPMRCILGFTGVRQLKNSKNRLVLLPTDVRVLCLVLYNFITNKMSGRRSS